MSSGINRWQQLTRFLRVAVLLLWTIWVIYRERRRVLRAREKGERVRPRVELLIRVLVAYRAAALKLGVLLIKLGQFLSSRADLLPEEALAVLSDLQDEVPPAPFSHVVSVIEGEFGRPVASVFSSIDEQCTAAASLAQVHRAVLAETGETVAVKVQRPHIEALVRMDLNTLHFVIRVVQRLTDTRAFMDLNGLYTEFRRTVYEEIDYVQEAANAERFRTMFENDPHLWIPRVYEAYVRPRVLVLQWVEGIKVNDYTGLDAAGIDRDQVARYLVEAYFHQFFIAGFFHADPHPGNIFIQKDGPRVYLIDFGMVGTLNSDMQKALRDLFSSYLTRDARRLVGALARLGFIGRGANIEAIEQAVDLLLQRYYGMTLREARSLDVGDVAHDIEGLLYGQPFQVPTRFAFTGKAIGTLVGVSTGLAPNFNFVEVAAPYARQFLGLDEDQGWHQVLDQVLQIGQVLLRLPGLLERVATKLESGRLVVRTGEAPSRRRGRRVESAGLGGSLVSCASVAGGVTLLLAGQVAGGWFCLGLAAVSVVWGRE